MLHFMLVPTTRTAEPQHLQTKLVAAHDIRSLRSRA